MDTQHYLKQLQESYKTVVEPLTGEVKRTFDFSTDEVKLQNLWTQQRIYDKIVDQNKNNKVYNSVDGPPFISSASLHMGHIHISMMKSTDINYRNMLGLNALNKIGFDCHGLPVEQVVSSLLNLHTNNDIRQYGLHNYNSKCEQIIQEYSGAWQPVFTRIGRFLDFSNEYKTMDLNFMESVWWVFGQLWKKNLVYRGYKIMPYSIACGTSLSASEASGDDVYKDVTDTAVYVKFKVVGKENTYFVAWTTTPWTLPSNLALAMSPILTYTTIKDKETGEHYIVTKSAVDKLYVVSKKKDEVKEKPYEIISTCLGQEYENTEYEPLFDYFKKDRPCFRVLMAPFVEEGSGTGIVHLAPSFGQEDFDICIAKKDCYY